MNWTEFFNMGGYAAYVWGSYGIFAAALLIETALTRRQWRAAVNERQTLQTINQKEAGDARTH